jgi:hypothetical protein
MNTIIIALKWLDDTPTKGADSRYKTPVKTNLIHPDLRF